MSMNPTSDLVAVAWVSGIAGLSSSVVSTNLPQDNSTWATSGFVTVSTIGGSPDLYVPIRQPVIQVDCWAVNPNSGRPPWGKANALAELVRAHVEAGPRASNFARSLTFPQGDYLGANVMDAIMRTEPRRGITEGVAPSGDEASYARYLFDLELHWRVAA
jgi:hypothetical protein